MKGFCISLDVSKGTSFYQGFKGIDEPITKPKKIEHNLEGFKELLKLKEKIRNEYNEDCVVIFESTGVYHKALQTYLDEHEFEYTIISPLLSAKVRKSDIRGTKTDAKDCSSNSLRDSVPCLPYFSLSIWLVVDNFANLVSSIFIIIRGLLIFFLRYLFVCDNPFPIF